MLAQSSVRKLSFVQVESSDFQPMVRGPQVLLKPSSRAPQNIKFINVQMLFCKNSQKFTTQSKWVLDRPQSTTKLQGQKWLHSNNRQIQNKTLIFAN